MGIKRTLAAMRAYLFHICGLSNASEADSKLLRFFLLPIEKTKRMHYLCTIFCKEIFKTIH